MTMTMAQARQIALPHTSPDAVAYKARPALTQQWKDESAAAYRTYEKALRGVAEAWYEHLATTGVLTGPGDLRPARPDFADQAPAGARRLRWHWQLCSSVGYDHTRLRLPDCHLIAHPGRCRGHAQAPDLRTRTGRAMQADLDALARVPEPTREHLQDLPQGTPDHDKDGTYLRRYTRRSHQVAPGSRYLVYEAPPAPAPDPALWEPVEMEEYLQVWAEDLLAECTCC